MREKRERKSRFWLGMLIYVLIFALLAGAALLFSALRPAGLVKMRKIR